MYQRTCHILPWLRQVSSPEIVTDLAEHLDVVTAAGHVSFVGVGGLERLGTVQFGPRLSIITGRLGKTRVLETLKQQADAAPRLPQPSVRVAPEQSPGQMRRAVLLELLTVQPEGSALLLDDFFDSVDRVTTTEALQVLGRCSKQVLLTVRPRILGMVRQFLRNADVLVTVQDW